MLIKIDDVVVNTNKIVKIYVDPNGQYKYILFKGIF